MGASLQLRIGERELTRLPESALPSPQREQRLAGVVAESLRARRGQTECSARAGPLEAEAQGRMMLAIRLSCPGEGMLEIESALPEMLGVPHHHFAHITDEQGASHEILLHAERPRWRQPHHGTGGGEPMRRAFTLGLEHILGGYDHLAFVAGLVLAAAGLSQVAAVVTGFTAAHSITLALAALALVRPVGAGIEIMIAFSIAVLAIENLMSASMGSSRRYAVLTLLALAAPAIAYSASGGVRIDPLFAVGMTLFSSCYLLLAAGSPLAARLRWVVAFVFGLLHGFGFAGAAMDAQFSQSSLLVTLLGFNLGVEAGQLAIVLLLWPLLAAARRTLRHGYALYVLEPASTALLAASTCWYLTRIFG
ncbi:MAG TPA: HupE/UreJ family protein [Candidatus Binatia bacterium]|nr:HupE/UreJ family protein [Candidatus Binatia bacterium]